MLQNPQMMEQMKIMMRDPAVKERMKRLLQRLGPDSSIHGGEGVAAGDDEAMDQIWERMQAALSDPAMLEKLSAAASSEKFQSRMQQLASDPTFAKAAGSYVDEMKQEVRAWFGALHSQRWGTQSGCSRGALCDAPPLARSCCGGLPLTAHGVPSIYAFDPFARPPSQPTAARVSLCPISLALSSSYQARFNDRGRAREARGVGGSGSGAAAYVIADFTARPAFRCHRLRRR